jgi:phosphate/sulfate permease
MFWNVFVWNMKIFPSTVFVFLSPLIGIAVTYFIYTYIKSIYRQVVVSINNENLNDFKDFDYYKNDIFESMGFPKYLNDIINDEEKLNKLKENKYTFHEHLNNRPTNLYENLIIFGHSGLYFLLNLIQCINVLFICWQIAIFGHFAEDIAIAYTNIMYFFLICCTIVYVFLQLFLTILTLKWLTIIDSIEMNRNEKCLKKMINKHIKRAGELSNSIFLAFKKIYFNMIFNKNETPGNEKEKFDEKQNLIDNESLNEEFEINNNDNNRKGKEKDKEEFKLVYENLKDILKLNYNRFKKMRNDNTIDIKNELQPFLKSCGNFLNEKEINFLLHLLQNSSNYNGTLNLDQLIFLCGCILHFQAQKPSEIIKYVIDQYYKKNPQYYKGKTMKWENIELFLNYYDYFTKNEIDFIKEQCDYIGNEFTLDGFISCVLSPSQFYAN